MSKSNLTGKQRLFINHYMSNGFNGSRAAKSAGYKGDYVTLASVAYENLRKPNIKAEIERRMKDVAMSPTEVIARIENQARGDMRELMGLSLDELKEHPQGNAIKKVKQRFLFAEDGKRYGEVLEVQTYDAQTALTTIAKHHGLLKDGTTININIELVVQAIQALEAAGLDPAVAFERLIQQAEKHAALLNG